MRASAGAAACEFKALNLSRDQAALVYIASPIG
jgi:hypothetical protein